MWFRGKVYEKLKECAKSFSDSTRVEEYDKSAHEDFEAAINMSRAVYGEKLCLKEWNSYEKATTLLRSFMCIDNEDVSY